MPPAIITSRAQRIKARTLSLIGVTMAVFILTDIGLSSLMLQPIQLKIYF
jgi:hypothetical protein